MDIRDRARKATSWILGALEIKDDPIVRGGIEGLIMGHIREAIAADRAQARAGLEHALSEYLPR